MAKLKLLPNGVKRNFISLVKPIAGLVLVVVGCVVMMSQPVPTSGGTSVQPQPTPTPFPLPACFEGTSALLTYTNTNWTLNASLKVLDRKVAENLASFTAAWALQDAPPMVRVSHIVSQTLNLYLDVDAAMLTATDKNQSDLEKEFWERTFFANILGPVMYGSTVTPRKTNLNIWCNCECDGSAARGIRWSVSRISQDVQKALECSSINTRAVVGDDLVSPIPLSATVQTPRTTWMILRGEPNDRPLFDRSMTRPELQGFAKAVTERYADSTIPSRDRVVVIVLSRFHELKSDPLINQERLLNEEVQVLSPNRHIRVFLLPVQGNASSSAAKKIEEELSTPTDLEVSMSIPKLLTASQARSADLRLQYPGCEDIRLEIPVPPSDSTRAKPSLYFLALLTALLAASGLAASLLLYRYNLLNLRDNLNEDFDFPWTRSQS